MAAVIWLLAILCGLVLLIGAGVMEMLRRIEKVIREDFESAVARSILQTEIKVVQPAKPKVKKECQCSHAETDHHPFEQVMGGSHRGGNCKLCECQMYRPKRGPWPTDPPKV